MSRESYDPKKIEAKWQAVWEKEEPSKALTGDSRPPFYCLVEFPFPSGEGLHVGHVRSYAALDAVARKARMEGKNVLFPIGWDAFGLPTENYAIKTGLSPAVVTKQNTDNFRRQLKSLGLSFDWSREVNTTDPGFYKWTQWIFLQLLKDGLAYKAKTPINWCPSCKIGLANEEAQGGVCDRCGTKTETREKEQWMLAITKYADRLAQDLDTVDFPERVKTQQRNWIGRSDGASIIFPLSGISGQEDGKHTVEVFTTRPDTFFGVTFLAIAPELAQKWLSVGWQADSSVTTYVQESLARRDEEDTGKNEKGKTGVPTGIFATHPATGEKIPVYVAEYVLGTVGTGAVMGVPAHDERDFLFAKKHNIPIKEVVIPERIDKRNPPVAGKKTVERRNVHAIVSNPKDGTILVLKLKNHPWTTFPMGGVEEGEDAVAAALREVKEETGYTNLRPLRVLGGEVRAEYFAAHKDENRVSYTQAVCLELVDETQEAISKEESDAHDIVWLKKEKINPVDMTHAEMDIWLARMNGEEVYEGDGVLIHSGDLGGMKSEEARKAVTTTYGAPKTTYKLRDWVFSRQRYWGEPIPVVHCPSCGIVPVPEKDLPVLLPDVVEYKPTDGGESPLASITDWVNTTCPTCGEKAKRETDTMPNWAGSSWYYLRYMDPTNNDAFVSKEALSYWSPVTWYNGGMEHTTLHLLYSRFWHKFLFDKGFVPTSEPYAKRTSHGLILAEGGVKMSKSKGNVVNPDTVVSMYGADTLRLYELFIGPFEQAVSWSDDSIIGCRRFIERSCRLLEKIQDKEISDPAIEQAIKKVTEDMGTLGFNTVVSTLMTLVGVWEKASFVSRNHFERFVRLLAPFAPHVAEELWQELGKTGSVHKEKWPEYDPSLLETKEVSLVVQVNGKVRGTLVVERGLSEEEISPRAQKLMVQWLQDKPIKKTIYVADKIINFVI